MKHYTTKTACSHLKNISHGKRRRLCLTCGKTWTVRQKKRGRKPRKKRIKNLARTFMEKLTLVQQAKRSGVSVNQISKQQILVLEQLNRRPWPHQVPKGKIILVIDALWFETCQGHQTIYLLGIKSVLDDKLIFLRPILRPGYESRNEWREIISKLPESVLKRICALVSDSFAGVGAITKEYGWVLQRCQAHLILRLSNLCGDNKWVVSWRAGRQEIRQQIRILFNTENEEAVQFAKDALVKLGNNPNCPTRLRLIVNSTVRCVDEFRACFLHPELRLPATTNSLENTNGRIRSLLGRSRGLRTPNSLLNWITGFLWFHPNVKCRPKNPQN